MNFTIGNYDIGMNFHARRSWRDPRFFRGDGIRHFVWGRISVCIEDWTAEKYQLCAECDSSEIGEQWLGDEGWTVCINCQSVEQGYRYVNKREFEEKAG